MRLPDRIIFTAGALALAFTLGGCESMPNLYGLEDMFSNKKPLPGERRAVFPEGVPGVAQGVPPELLPANQSAEAQAAATGEPTETGATPAKPEAAAKPKPKEQPKKEATRSRPPAAEPTATRQEQAAQPWPPPPRQQPPQQQQQAEQPWPAPTRQQQPAAAPWPDAPQSGTFTR